jgi:phosphatidate cytidylyltransferase
MMKTRILTSVFLMLVFIGLLFLPYDLPYFLPGYLSYALSGILWALTMLLVIAIGAWEWGRLARFNAIGQKLYVLLIVVAGLLMVPGLWTVPALAYFSFGALFWGMLLAAIFWLVVVPISLFTRRCASSSVFVAVTGVLVLLPTWLALVHLRSINPFLLLGLVMTVWIADSAAYFAGKAFGRHKLVPEISPGKTWEGVAGALVVVAIYGLVLCRLLHFDYWLIVALWVLTIMSIIGDLFESLLKRNVGIKDSGSILPGHGGILDRIDGLTAMLPIATFYIFFPLYVSAFRA